MNLIYRIALFVCANAMLMGALGGAAQAPIRSVLPSV